jgi:2-amino-4-hydroxy-6-hydroxymethyldihydropteridine diphosphokinase
MRLSQTPDGVRPTTVYLGLGSNRGDRRAFIHSAVSEIIARGALRDVVVSPLYETEAVADHPQPPYLNGVMRGETSLLPHLLLQECLDIERGLGRVRPRAPAKAARTIDIDLLLYGDQIIDTPTLKVPHPAMLTRTFVLIPLADVARQGLIHPQTLVALSTLAADPP